MCGDMATQALQAIEDLFHKIQRKDPPKAICAAAQNSTELVAEYAKTVSNQMVLLRHEVTAAYRMRDIFDIRRLTIQKLLVVVRGKILLYIDKMCEFSML